MIRDLLITAMFKKIEDMILYIEGCIAQNDI